MNGVATDDNANFVPRYLLKNNFEKVILKHIFGENFSIDVSNE